MVQKIIDMSCILALLTVLPVMMEQPVYGQGRPLSATEATALKQNDGYFQSGHWEFTSVSIMDPRVYRHLHFHPASPSPAGGSDKEFDIEYKKSQQPHQSTFAYNDRGQHRWSDRNPDGTQNWEELLDGKHVFRTNPQNRVVSVYPPNIHSFPEAKDNLIVPVKCYGLGHGFSRLRSLRILSENADTITVSAVIYKNSPIQAELSRSKGFLARALRFMIPPQKPTDTPRVLQEIVFSHPRFLSKPGIWVNTECVARSFAIDNTVSSEERYRLTKIDLGSNRSITVPEEWETWTLMDSRLPEGYMYSYAPGEWKMSELDTVIPGKTRASYVVEKKAEDTIAKEKARMDALRQKEQNLLLMRAVSALTAFASLVFCVVLLRRLLRKAP